MDDDQLDAFLQKTRKVISNSPDMDEANTKAKVVQPLLETLGWDIAADADLEHAIPIGSTTHHVDYALELEGVSELFVEVKGCYTDLNDRHLEQLFTYMKTQNVDWGLLTNARSYYVCRRRVTDNSNVVVDVLGDFTLEDFAEHSTLLSALSKKSIAEGRSEEIAGNLYKLRESYSTLQDQRETLVNEIASVIIANLGDQVTHHAEYASKNAVEVLSKSIKSDAMGIPEANPAGTFWNEVEAETSIVKQGAVVVFPEDRTATNCFADFVDFLFEQEYLDENDIPITSGRKRYLINHEPLDREGDEMYSPREVGDGYFLETNYSVNDIKQRILELSEIARE